MAAPTEASCCDPLGGGEDEMDCGLGTHISQMLL